MPIEPMRRAWMEVDCRALRANYETVTQRIPAGCRMLPMVKADAYGTGVALAVRNLAPLGPYGFGVATVQEGRELRREGWGGRIVVFTPLLPADVGELLAAGLEPVVGGLDALRACAAGARESGERIDVHLEIDTGMGRFGLSRRGADEWIPALRRELEAGGARLASTFTHFHSAESDVETTREQWRELEATREAMSSAGVDPGLSHAANSAAAVEYSGVAADMVRPGIWLYGAEVAGRRPKPVVAVRARVLAVRDVPAGSTVSYGATWRAPAPARLATLGIGYADGLRRGLSGRSRALVKGRAAPVRGVITMDSTVIDVTGRNDVEPGDVATLLGADGDEEITLEELAEACGTIAYEILTGWSRRVPKIGMDGDE